MAQQQTRFRKILKHMDTSNQPSLKRYAIFICGPDLPNPIGDYGDMIIRLLSTKDASIRFDKFVVYKSDPMPSFAHLVTYYNGIIFSGSRFDAHSMDKWCVDLRSLIRSIYDYNLQQVDNKANIVKMIGICFGHQVIAHSLDGKSGRNDKTIWEMGIKKLSLTKAFHQKFKCYDDLKSLNILQMHRDAVLTLPSNAQLLAYSDKTGVEMYCVDDMIFCMQGHPEFNKQYVRTIVAVKAKDKSSPDEEMKYALESMEKYETSNDIFRRLLLDFIQGK